MGCNMETWEGGGVDFSLLLGGEKHKQKSRHTQTQNTDKHKAGFLWHINMHSRHMNLMSLLHNTLMQVVIVVGISRKHWLLFCNSPGASERHLLCNLLTWSDIRGQTQWLLVLTSAKKRTDRYKNDKKTTRRARRTHTGINVTGNEQSAAKNSITTNIKNMKGVLYCTKAIKATWSIHCCKTLCIRLQVEINSFFRWTLWGKI